MCVSKYVKLTYIISVSLIGCLGGIATPEVRAMMSEIVDSNEQGDLLLIITKHIVI